MNRIQDARRFEVIETGEVVAIVDSCRTWTKYAPVCVDMIGQIRFDLSATRTYFADELREL